MVPTTMRHHGNRILGRGGTRKKKIAGLTRLEWDIPAGKSFDEGVTRGIDDRPRLGVSACRDVIQAPGSFHLFIVSRVIHYVHEMLQ